MATQMNGCRCNTTIIEATGPRVSGEPRKCRLWLSSLLVSIWELCPESEQSFLDADYE